MDKKSGVITECNSLLLGRQLQEVKKNDRGSVDLCVIEAMPLRWEKNTLFHLS